MGHPHPWKQCVYPPHYVDAIALRYYDADTNGSIVKHYCLQDANFNITAAVDAAGTVVERYAYTPYGEVTVLNPDFSAVTGNASAIGNELLYTGRRLDPETGLQLNRNRFYAAGLGRWVSRDPIGYAGGSPNLYEYVGGRPTYYVDPSGETNVNTGVEWCEGYQKGHWVFSWFSIHDFVVINEKGYGVFRDKCGNTKVREDDHIMYQLRKKTIRKGEFFSECDPIYLDDRRYDIEKFRREYLKCIKNKKCKPSMYVPGFNDCTSFVRHCTYVARDKSRIWGNSDCDPPVGP